MNYLIRFLLLAFKMLIIMLLFNSCSENNQNILHTNTEIIWEEQGYAELSLEELPNTYANINEADKLFTPFDKDSIEMFDYRGMVSYHPVFLGNRCQTFINAYYKTNNDSYLERAEKYAVKLMSIADNINNSLYVRYDFNFSVHADSANTFYSPWYSGMAQGVMLIDFTRLYQITNKKKYLLFADKIFNSFLALRHRHEIWTVRIDSSGYYWVEEYPHDSIPGMTLNGYNSAIAGIYEYYRLTKKPIVKKIFDMSITTIKHYISEFRVENDYSLYCLGHRDITKPGYHHLHIKQLGQLFKMTNDPFFSEMGQLLKNDVSE